MTLRPCKETDEHIKKRHQTHAEGICVRLVVYFPLSILLMLLSLLYLGKKKKNKIQLLCFIGLHQASFFSSNESNWSNTAGITGTIRPGDSTREPQHDVLSSPAFLRPGRHEKPIGHDLGLSDFGQMHNETILSIVTSLSRISGVLSPISNTFSSSTNQRIRCLLHIGTGTFFTAAI